MERSAPSGDRPVGPGAPTGGDGTTSDGSTGGRGAFTGERLATPGVQSLVRTPSGADPLSALPERAYDNLLVVATRDHPNKIEHRLERAGLDGAGVGVVPAIPAATEYRGDLWTTDPVRPDDLTGIGMRFSDAVRHVEEDAGWVFVDSLGVLLMYADDDRVCRFFQTLVGRVRARGARGVYCVDPAAVADETYERLRGLCDAECELA
ncbi:MULTISPECIES: DUF835 domain-containing protein [Halorussus]|uniref:DUF835 domain-containing protein n=1 Tax=Halorussus TaxID=1070314 RepID=UPI00209E11EC|nr:DUF835 domain-containing protein [Halorussus vallis]USZ76963.1 DUF835 domain-containing protein [Halorussus vallis]